MSIDNSTFINTTSYNGEYNIPIHTSGYLYTSPSGGAVTILGNGGVNALRVSGNKVWNAGNDGSGSGLDADLLDGQHGSYYKDTPSGTVVVFYQSSAPTGWTKVTSQNNKALRVVSGTGGGSGGSNNFTTAFNSSRSTSGGSVNNHTLSTSQMPAHQHHGRGPNHDTNSANSQGYPANNNHNSFRTSDRGRDRQVHIDAIESTGGSQAHNHGFTNPNINLNVQYIDVIICRRDS